jgi:hypothetical protein
MRIINNIKEQKNYVAYWEIQVNWTAGEDEKS